MNVQTTQNANSNSDDCGNDNADFLIMAWLAMLPGVWHLHNPNKASIDNQSQLSLRVNPIIVPSPIHNQSTCKAFHVLTVCGGPVY